MYAHSTCPCNEEPEKRKKYSHRLPSEHADGMHTEALQQLKKGYCYAYKIYLIQNNLFTYY